MSIADPLTKGCQAGRCFPVSQGVLGSNGSGVKASRYHSNRYGTLSTIDLDQLP
jgi:hypothetical protein